jgi:hypothetical protein
LRVAVLFPPDMTHVSQVPSLFMDNFRTLETPMWEIVAQELIDMVPLVIVDMRQQAMGVLRELEYLVDSRQTDKVIFVVDPNGAAPQLDFVNAWRAVQGLPSLLFDDVTQVTERDCPAAAVVFVRRRHGPVV